MQILLKDGFNDPARTCLEIDLSDGSLKYVHNQIKIPSIISEHYELARPDLPHVINNMKDPFISVEEVKAQLNRLKQGKAPGPDSLKPELYVQVLMQE